MIGMRGKLLGLSLLRLGAGPVLAQPAADPGNGRSLAVELCRGCHLVGPDHAGPVPDGVPSFMAIASRPAVDARAIEAALISPPHPLMPSPPLDTRQMRDIAAYILSLRP
jgi:mono/diheme cytochrome c family protein